MKYILAALLAMTLSTPVFACGQGGQCEVAERSYAAKLPSGWDGDSALPVLLHFHGWGRQGKGVTRNRRIAGAAQANGVLLLAPDGIGKSWNFWGDDRRDIAFAEDVLADAATRWPIDRDRVFISGFSYGSAMAWFFACEQGDRYAGIFGIAGTLRGMDRLDCATGPLTMRHVHGAKDTVMRLHGGMDAVDEWAALSGCDERIDTPGPKKAITIWQGCAEGRDVRIERHSGGHIIPKGWLRDQLADLLDR